MMYSIYLLLAAILCSTTLAKSVESNNYKDCGRGPNYKLRSKRLAGGYEADPNSWPFVVKLETTLPNKPDDIELCGGTLLDHHHILTAAHCIDTTHGKPTIEAFLGMHNVDAEEGFVKRNVDHYWRFQFNDDIKIDDLAILRMNTRVEYNDKISPVCLPQGNNAVKDFTNATVTVVGWGHISDFREDTSSVLKQGNLKIISNELCKEHFFQNTKNVFVKDKMFCTISPDRKTKLLGGDSGGPVLYQESEGSPWIQIGINSYIAQVKHELKNPKKFSYGAIMTRVASYLDVIREEIRNLEKKSRG